MSILTDKAQTFSQWIFFWMNDGKWIIKRMNCTRGWDKMMDVFTLIAKFWLTLRWPRTTVFPWQDHIHRCKEIIKAPGNNYVVVSVYQKSNDKHTNSDTCKKLKSWKKKLSAVAFTAPILSY